MSGRGVIFTDESVRAILAGRKTQTRRVVDMKRVEFIGGRGMENDPAEWGYGFSNGKWAVLARGLDERHAHGRWSIPCPYGAVGSLLWVKESWAVDAELGQVKREREDMTPGLGHGPYYRADRVHEDTGLTWRTPLFMPRWASRITLRVTEVRVQRLQGITSADALAEGCMAGERASETDAFHNGWDKINGKKAPWASNPWVFAVTFERVV